MPGLFDGPLAGFVALVMARANRDAEAEAVALLAPGPADTVLAVGFGPGVGVRLLAGRLPSGRVVGVDPSPAMVKLAARANRAAVKAGRVELHGAYARAIPAPDGVFDGVIAVNSLQFCEPLQPTARELARVMKPGALLVSLTHDWALERHAGSVEAWTKAAAAQLAAEGFEAVRDFRGQAEKGRIVALTARSGRR